MLYKNYLMVFLLLLITACQQNSLVRRGAVPDREESRQHKAQVHYLNGALHDFQDEYKSAINEYAIALKYDTSSAEILKAIGRNHQRLGEKNRALYYLQRAYDREPLDQETLYLLAEACYDLKAYEKAARYFAELHLLIPYNRDIHTNLIFLYSQLGESKKLIDFRERLHDLYGFEDESTYQLVTLYMQFNRMEKALTLLQELLEQDSLSAQNWIIYGNLLEHQERPVEAAEAYRRALELDPAGEEAIEHLFDFYSTNENWAELVKIFGQFVDEGEYYSLRLYLSRALLKSEAYDEARSTLRPLQKVPRYAADAYTMMAQISLAEGKLDEARDSFRRLTELEPWNSRSWIFLATLYVQKSDYGNAVGVLEGGLTNHPNNEQLLSLYGYTLERLSRNEEAISPLRRAHKLNPQNLNTIISLGMVYDDLGLNTQLDSLYTEALRLYPDNALILNNFSYSLSERNEQLERALTMASRAVELEPDNPAYLDTIGWIYYKLGRYEMAREHIGRAVDVFGESSAEVLEHLGDVYLKTGNGDQARQLWERALEKDPGNEQLQQKLR